jgi:hypothetical protein
MKVKVIAQDAIRHPEHGMMLPGQEYEVASLSGIRDHVKVVSEYDTKVIVERPTVAAGEPLSASPVAPASPEQTVTRRRRGRRSAKTED